MPAPSVISVTATSYNSATSPRTTASISIQSGDILVAFAAMENSAGGTTNKITISDTGGLIGTWTRQQEYSTSNTSTLPYVTVFTATATGTGSVTVSFTRVAGTTEFGGEVHVWRGSDGIGNTNVANNGTGSGTPSVSVTTTQADSGLSAMVSDWNAAGAATWTTTAGAVVERTDFTHASGFYSVHSATYADVDAAASKTVGNSAPTTQRYGIVVVEIKGTASTFTWSETSGSSQLMPRKHHVREMVGY